MLLNSNQELRYVAENKMTIGLYAEIEDIDTMNVNDSALRIFLAMV